MNKDGVILYSALYFCLMNYTRNKLLWYH